MDFHCPRGQYERLCGQARQYSSYITEGWSPDWKTDYTRPSWDQPGRCWFAFGRSSDALLFKLASVLVD